MKKLSDCNMSNITTLQVGRSFRIDHGSQGYETSLLLLTDRLDLPPEPAAQNVIVAKRKQATAPQVKP
jgi:hypothetical protein